MEEWEKQALHTIRASSKGVDGAKQADQVAAMIADHPELLQASATIYTSGMHFGIVMAVESMLLHHGSPEARAEFEAITGAPIGQATETYTYRNLH